MEINVKITGDNALLLLNSLIGISPAKKFAPKLTKRFAVVLDQKVNTALVPGGFTLRQKFTVVGVDDTEAFLDDIVKNIEDEYGVTVEHIQKEHLHVSSIFFDKEVTAEPAHPLDALVDGGMVIEEMRMYDEELQMLAAIWQQHLQRPIRLEDVRNEWLRRNEDNNQR